MKNLKLYNIEFIQQLTAFTKRLKDQGKSAQHVGSLTNRLKEFFHYLEQIQIERVSQINQRIILEYRSYMLGRPNIRTGEPLSNRYINKHGEAILRFMEMFYQRALGKSDYSFPLLSRSSTKDIEVLTEEEIQRVYSAIDNSLTGITNRAIISLLYGCGLRRGELYNLEVNDINFSQGEIRLDNTKTHHERDVPMSPTVVRYLEEYLYSAREQLLSITNENHVLISQRGKRMSSCTIYDRVKNVICDAGITKSVSPHILRHSIGTHLLGDFTLEEIADFLGHKDLDSTQIYTHLKETIA